MPAKNETIMHLRDKQVVHALGLYQYDYGQRLIFTGVDLPTAYEVHFSNKEHGKSKTMIGDETGVAIPDEYLVSGDPVYVWVFLHEADSDGETEYHGIIDVKKRAKPIDTPPTPVQQDVITQAIAALNSAEEHVDSTAEHIDTVAEAIPQTIDDALAEAKASGEFDGFSPVATVSKEGHVATISITDVNGTTTAEVKDGDDSTMFIDDTSTAPDMVWSAQKSNTLAPKANPVFTGSISLGRKENSTVGSNSIAAGYDVTAKSRYQAVFGQYNTDVDINVWTANTHYYVGDIAYRQVMSSRFYIVCVEENTDSTFDSSKWENAPIGYTQKDSKYALSVGIGSSVSPANGFSVDWGGDAFVKGDLYVGCDNDGTGGKKVAKEEDIPDLEDLIDDTAGEGDTDKVWSADKVSEEFNEVQTAISQINSFEVRIVQQLPLTGDPHVVYFVPKTGSTGDVYDEYMYVNNAWELIGTTQIDLSGKADKVSGATNGNFAGLDANGNLTDSGKKASDFGTYSKPSGGIPSTDLASTVQTSLGKADTAYQKPSGGIPATDMSSEVATLLGKADSAYQKPDGGIPSTDLASGVIPDITGKADKVASATNGNFAGLDSNGNLTDSGKSASDFGTYSKPSGGIPSTDLADTYIEEPSSEGTNGQVLTTDGNGGRSWTTVQGGGGTSDYSDLSNKPQIGGVTLVGNKSLSDLGIAAASDIPNVTGKADKVASATSGNFAGLDSNGNLTDSGSKASDFGTYSKPSGGIPGTDLADTYIEEPSSDGTNGQVLTTDGNGGRSWTTVDASSVIDDTAGDGDTDKTWSADKLVDEFDAKYEKPSGGIPSTDMASAVQTSLGKADSAYQKPSGGIPSTDLATEVQTSLGLADTAYQKPNNGIPASDLASGVIPSVPVQDVQIKNTSILNNGVANIPLAATGAVGLVQGNNTYGTAITAAGDIMIYRADDSAIKNGNGEYKPIVPYTEHQAVFYGLAKAAGDTTQRESQNNVGIYTSSAQSAIQTMLDVPSTSSVTSSIASAIGNVHSFDVEVVQSLPAQNIKEHTIYFVPKTGETNDVYDEYIYVNNAWEMIGNTQVDISGKADKVTGATNGNFAGLDSNGNLTDSGKKASDFGTYSKPSGGIPSTDLTSAVQTSLGKADTAYQKPSGGIPATDIAAGVIPTVPVTDIQVNGTSVVTSGVANIPIASSSAPGVVTVNGNGIRMIDGVISTYGASDLQIKTGTATFTPITPAQQFRSVFYGLAKAAGDSTQSASSNAVGTYTDDAKTAIKSMLGVTDPTVTDVQVDGTSVVTSGVGNVPKASSSTLGVIKVGTGVSVDSGGSLSADNEVLVSSTQPSENGNKLWIDNSSNGNEYSVPTVAEINALSADVIHSPASPSSGDFLVYNGSAWVAQSSGSVTVDDELSESSTNPVQNKVITDTIYELAENGYISGGGSEPQDVYLTLNSGYIDVFTGETKSDNEKGYIFITSEQETFSLKIDTSVYSYSLCYINGSSVAKYTGWLTESPIVFDGTTHTQIGITVKKTAGGNITSLLSEILYYTTGGSGSIGNLATKDYAVSKQQNVSDAGKVLGIGNDGSVTPVSVSVSVTVDDTLTEEGEAADAKATGDRIDEVAENGFYKIGGSIQQDVYLTLTSGGINSTGTIGPELAKGYIWLTTEQESLVLKLDTTVYKWNLCYMNNGTVAKYTGWSTDSPITFDSTTHTQIGITVTKQSGGDISSLLSQILYYETGEQQKVGNLATKDYVANFVPKSSKCIYPDGFSSRIMPDIYNAGRYMADINISSYKISGTGEAWVATDGNDTTGDGTKDNPYATITKALTASAVTIHIKAGTYTQGTHYATDVNLGGKNVIGHGDVVFQNDSSGHYAKTIGNAYIEGITFKHGNASTNSAFFAMNNASGQTVCFVNCVFRDGGANGLELTGIDAVVVGCVAYGNKMDGFNYHKKTISSVDYVPNILEIDCVAYNNGSSESGSDSCNGSTAHDGAQIVRLNGEYYSCYGGVIAEIGGTGSGDPTTKSVNFGVLAHDSTGTGTYKASFWASYNTEMYLYDCKSFGGTYDISAINDAKVVVWRLTTGRDNPEINESASATVIVDPSVPVTDVQVNGTSVVSQGVANVPIAGTSALGVVKPAGMGVNVNSSNGEMYIGKASEAQIKAGVTNYFPIVPSNQDAAAFYGLAKAAGDSTQASSSNAVGTYTDNAQVDINKMIGSLHRVFVANIESGSTATQAWNIGDIFIWQGGLVKAISAIAIGDTFVIGENNANVEATKIVSSFSRDVQVNGTSVVSNGVANIPKASTSDLGVSKIASWTGVKIEDDGALNVRRATEYYIKPGTNTNYPITPDGQHISTFFGLAKAAGDSTQSASSNAVGTYTADAKAAIQSMLGVMPEPTTEGTNGQLLTTDGNGGRSWTTIPSFYRQAWNSTTSASVPLNDTKSYFVWSSGSSAGTTGAIMDSDYGCLLFVSNGKYAVLHKGSNITLTDSGTQLTVSSSTAIAMAVVEL